MKKRALEAYISAIAVGIIATCFAMSSAYAQSQIRLNPAYSAPETNEENELIVSEILLNEFNQFLNAKNSEEPDQYIQLKNPEDEERSVLSLSENDNEDTASLEFSQEYIYNPSLSFNLPSSTLSYGGAATMLGGSQFVLSLSSSDDLTKRVSKNKSLRILVGSSFMQTSLGNYTNFLDSNLTAQQSYNLTFGVNYSGFQVGASYSRNDYLFSSDLSGFDFGLGYNGESWSANLRVGEYRRNNSLLLTPEYNIFDNVSAFELGATYKLFSNINFTGRFTYYSYGNGTDIVPLDDVKTFIFGTNLSF